VEEICGLAHHEHGQRSFKTTSSALTLGNLLNKCCSLKSGTAIRQKDDLSLKDVERFASLYKSEFSDSMCCPALSSLKVNSYNKPHRLPSTDDLVKLKQFTEDKMDTLMKELKSSPSYKVWRMLSCPD